ncbi:hypothetical protein AB6A40_003318 [Gnathostoma spinigerum]|uniref:KANL2-like probable zinc-finger domain-containing protein n=1 Tax=Gnathostoma spinigerum TaxID=75299 RepID=A0ABD6EH05_9BILA
MSDQLISSSYSQPSHSSSPINSISSSSSDQQERGYTIVVPASVCIRGVNMQLDLKIDQKALAAASDISKVVEEAVSNHFSSAPAALIDGGDVHSVRNTTVRLSPSSSNYQPSQIVFPVSGNTTESNQSAETSLEYTEVKKDLKPEGGKVDQVDEVCSSTGDGAQCDTASSPSSLSSEAGKSKAVPVRATEAVVVSISSEYPSASSSSQSVLLDQQQPSSSSNDEVHSSLEENMVQSMHSGDRNVVSGSVTPSPSPSSASDTIGVSPSCSGLQAVVHSRKRREKSAQQSHFCEQNDPGGKGQCRQRAILSYRYCIRHILLDPNAPYRQCQHKRKPKSKKDTNLYCTNAIRNDKDSVYCSTHMIMNGMMEPKKRNKNVVRQEAEASEVRVNNTHAEVAWTGENSVNNMNCLTENLQPSGFEERQPMTPTPLPPIAQCGFEQHHVQTINETDCWMVEGSSNSSPLLADPVTNNFVQNEQAYHSPITREQVSYGGTYPSASTVQQPPYNASYSAAAPAPSNAPMTVQFDESYGIPMCSNQIQEDMPCSSNILPPSPSSRHLSPAQLQQHVVAQQSVTYPPSQSNPQLPTCSNSSLSRQHPQLAAKLLQAPSTVTNGLNSQTPTSLVQPVTVQSTTLPSQVPLVRSDFSRNIQISAGSSASQNAILPWSAPLLLQRPPSNAPPEFYSLDDIDDEYCIPSPQPPRKKVIRLKQKRQKMKMIGPYRRIPPIDQMCKMLEDADFDQTDLFPLGLEPSDDEDELSDSESIRWCGSMERVGDDGCSSGALELYLLKKQLRLERHTLFRQAQLNAPVILASKELANSAGAALSHRASRRGARRSPQLKRCSHMASQGCSPAVRCHEVCLPMSNHCAKHVLYNVHQKLFSYCLESCCGQPVLCVDSPITSGLCQHHFAISQTKQGECSTYAAPPTPSSYMQQQQTQQSVQSSIPSIDFLQQPSLTSNGYQSPYDPMPSRLALSLESALSPRNIDSHCLSDFNEVEGADTDVSLASVAKDLGFDGRELTDMLAALPAAEHGVDDDDPNDLLHDSFSGIIHLFLLFFLYL